MPRWRATRRPRGKSAGRFVSFTREETSSTSTRRRTRHTPKRSSNASPPSTRLRSGSAVVKITSRAASSTSAMMSTTRARKSCWRERIETFGEVQAVSRSLASLRKSAAPADCIMSCAAGSRRAWQASTWRSAVSQLFSNCAAISRLSGSQAA